MGSFEQWAEWVRDPLLALGCQDPVIGTRNAKAADPERQEMAELFTLWHRHHGEEAVAAKDLHQDVLSILNPNKRARQLVTRTLQRMAGMRHAGFVLTESHWRGRWSPPTFALQNGQGKVLETPETDPPAQEQVEVLETLPAGLETHRRQGVSGTIFGAADQHKLSKTANHVLETPETPKSNTNIHARGKIVEKGDEADEKSGLRPARAMGGKPSGVSGVSGPSPKKGSDWWRDATLFVARRNNTRRAKEQSERGVDDMDADPDPLDADDVNC